MAWKIRDFECPECGNQEEHTVKEEDGVITDPPDGPVCLETTDQHGTGEGVPCNTLMIPVITMAAAPVTIRKGNSDYAERERARLVKRSRDHFATKGRDEAKHNEEKQQKQIAKTLGL